MKNTNQSATENTICKHCEYKIRDIYSMEKVEMFYGYCLNSSGQYIKNDAPEFGDNSDFLGLFCGRCDTELTPKQKEYFYENYF